VERSDTPGEREPGTQTHVPGVFCPSHSSGPFQRQRQCEIRELFWARLSGTRTQMLLAEANLKAVDSQQRLIADVNDIEAANAEALALNQRITQVLTTTLDAPDPKNDEDAWNTWWYDHLGYRSLTHLGSKPSTCLLDGVDTGVVGPESSRRGTSGLRCAVVSETSGGAEPRGCGR